MQCALFSRKFQMLYLSSKVKTNMKERCSVDQKGNLKEKFM